MFVGEKILIYERMKREEDLFLINLREVNDRSKSQFGQSAGELKVPTLFDCIETSFMSVLTTAGSQLKARVL